MRQSGGASSVVPRCFAKLSPKPVGNKEKQCCDREKPLVPSLFLLLKVQCVTIISCEKWTMIYAAVVTTVCDYLYIVIVVLLLSIST